MDMWMASLSRPRETELESFERAILETSRVELEKNAGEFTEAMNSLLDTPKTAPRVDRLLEQTKLAYRMGQELAIKQAGLLSMAGQAMGALKPMAGKALGWAAKNPGHAMAAGGAALGAMGGAATAQPGHRLGGALGGAVAGGAAGYGASKLPRGMGQKAMDYTSGAANMGLNRMGMQMKFAGVGLAAGGALLGGAMGAMHTSDAAKQGLAPAHHLRNALLGAAGGAALGGAGGKVLGRGAAAEGSVAAKMKGMPTMPSGPAASFSAQETSRIRNMMEQGAHGDPRRLAWIQRNNPHLYPEMAGAPTGVRPPTHGVVEAPAPAMAGTAIGKRKTAGREFIKMAFSMSAQAEPGTPGGAQEPEESDQQLMPPGPPARPASKPAVELFGALKHLSPKTMRGLQVAQPGT